jgi:Tat protein secretion system quality control protein TatD with DNase activity
MVWHTARRVAELRGMSLDDLAAATVENTQRRFGRVFAPSSRPA